MRRKKYALGNVVRNYIPDPSSVLAQNEINHSKANFEGESNPLIMALSTLGQLSMGVGAKMGGGKQLMGMIGLGGEEAEDSFAFGGEVTPLNDDEKNLWNGYTDYLNKLGKKGSPELNSIKTSKKYFNDYVSANKLDLDYDTFVPRVQKSMIDYRQGSIEKIKSGKQILDGVKDLKTYDFNDFMPNLSLSDGIAGEKTTSWAFPKAFKQTVTDGVIKKESMGLAKLAFGGRVPKVPVEVEGGEVAQLPTGELVDFEGPKHESGGIDADLPGGTIVYSDRISVDGKTMQERKKSREKRMSKLAQLLESNPTDTINRNTHDRSRIAIDQEEQHDLMVQEAFNLANKPKQKFAGGGQVPYMSAQNPEFDIHELIGRITGLGSDIPEVGMAGVSSLPGIVTPKTLPGVSAPSVNAVGKTGILQGIGNTLEEGFAGFSAGDLTGMLGSAIGGLAPLANTEANRAGDTPNVNSYADFGKDALAVNDKAKTYIQGQEDNAMQNLQLSLNASKKAGRNSARGVNQMRALDLAADMQGNVVAGNINDSFSKQMMQLLGQESQLENQQDAYVMQGNAQKEQADRQDRDAYFSNRGQDLVGLANFIQTLGRDLNSNKYNEDVLDIMPDTNKYGYGYERKGGRLRQTKSKKR